MADSLKDKTVAGMLWSSIGKFGAMGLSFVANLVLARLLLPEHFGCIGMLYIFIAISQAFIYGGLATALIQKKDAKAIDYTTVFYWNLTVSILCMGILYLVAPAIARFYEMPLLSNLLRVQSLMLLICSFSAVQSTILQKTLRFKSLAIRNIISTGCGVIVAVIMAYKGFGVWSLVANGLVSGVVSVFLLWNMSSWRPTFEFSIQSFKELFGFGGLILISSVVETLYTHIQGLIIGKLYTADDMGYYSQARKLEEIPTMALSSIVNDVSFPVFSKLQDDKEQMVRGLRKVVKSITYMNFPMMVMLIIIAQPLIHLLYTDKWDGAVLYFQILCVGSMAYTLNTLNVNVVKSLGKGNIYLVLQLTKRFVGLALLVAGILFGIQGLLWAVTINVYVSFLISAFVSGRLINYGIRKQLRDIAPSYFIAWGVGALVYWIFKEIEIHYVVEMIAQVCVYAAIYLGVTILLKQEGFYVYWEIAKKYIDRFRK